MGGRRALLRPAGLPAHARRALPEPDRARARVPRRSGRGGLPEGGALGAQPAAGAPSRGLGLPQARALLRPHHPRGIRRPRLLGPGVQQRLRQARLPLAGALGRGAHPQFGRPGRAPPGLRHRGAAPLLSPPPRPRRGDPLLRPHRARGRLRRRLAHLRRGRLPRPGRPALPAAELAEALHHPRPGRHPAGPRRPAARSGEPA